MVTLITRPQPEAELLQRKLTEMHIASIAEPLFTISPVHENYSIIEQILTKDRIQLIIITSINALRVIARLSNICNTTMITVGKATAIYAKKLGFKYVINTNYDANTLASHIIKNYDPLNGLILYPSARIISQDVPLILKDKGFEVRRIIIYDTISKQSLSKKIIEMIQKGQISAILFFSVRTVEIFITLAIQHKINYMLNSIQVFSLSNNITKYLKELHWHSIHTAPEPTQDALLKLLKDKL